LPHKGIGPVAPPKVMPPKGYEWRVHGLSNDGGRIADTGSDPEAIARGMEQIGYTVVKVERREISPWETVMENEAGIQVTYEEVTSVELAGGV
jgi:hypothetical protein